MKDLLPVKEAQQQVLRAFQPVNAVSLPIDLALHRILSANISAGLDLPPFTNSSMDGFAVRAADTLPGVVLAVIGDIPAGTHPTLQLQPGQAARIMTGAPLPPGADAVVPVEDTDASPDAGQALPDAVTINKQVAPGDYLRAKGMDVRAGTVVLQAPRRLRPQDLGMLAAVGLAEVPVYRQPRVGLLSSGDELLAPGEALQPGKIRDTNTITLASLIKEQGCEIINLGLARDNPEHVKTLLDRAVEAQVDVLITSAGVSVGNYDYVRAVIESGGRLDFWKVNMRPGKPLAFGSYRGIPIIGLPGNPVSAFVGFLVFVVPVLRRLSGLAEPEPHSVKAELGESITSDGRESYLRAALKNMNGKWEVFPLKNQSSGNLLSLVQANALLVVPLGVKSLPVGTKVDVWPLDINVT